MKRIFILSGVLVFLIIVLVFLLIFFTKNLRDNNKALKYFNKGDFKTASEILNKQVQDNPNNNDILINSSGVDYKLNKFDESKLKYNKVLSSSMSAQADKFVSYYNLGNAEFKQGNINEAINFYKEAIKINPDDKDSKYNLEVALKKLNEKGLSQNQNKQQDKNKDQQNKKEQDLKRQMEQNEKAQEDNKKQQQDLKDKKDKGNNKNKNQNSKKEKELNKEKQNLDKQKQEISEKIKNLQNSELEKSQNNQKAENKQEKGDDSKESNKEKKDTSGSILLNYYNESDKNTNRPKKKLKGYQMVKPQKDW
ncbi:MAG: tetratricopeptide repeat protein [Endomicrobium sp.]|jgi:tetratricopeptide (TPR) repeat protein|nr:tetratricopeptide repeat protein [Endomicrobium sp.]